jgi:microcystin degradation protein MlrC
MERGRQVDLGRTAVLQRAVEGRHRESCQSANDPAWCALHDIDLSSTALFCVKAKNHFRAGFGAMCGAIIDVETPGPAPADLTRLPFTRVPRTHLIQGQGSSLMRDDAQITCAMTPSSSVVATTGWSVPVIWPGPG